MHSQPTALTFADGWLLEAVAAPRTPLWICGAGHVGRALVAVLAPLDQFDLTWIDTAPTASPTAVPAGVTQLIAANPADLVQIMRPADAQHLILTYSHALDLALCHRLLAHGFAAAGSDRLAHQMGAVSQTPWRNSAIATPRSPASLPDRRPGPGQTSAGDCHRRGSRPAITRGPDRGQKGQGKLMGND